MTTETTETTNARIGRTVKMIDAEALDRLHRDLDEANDTISELRDDLEIARSVNAGTRAALCIEPGVSVIDAAKCARAGRIRAERTLADVATVLGVKPGQNVVQALFDRINALVFERNAWIRCAEARGYDLAQLETSYHEAIDSEVGAASKAAVDLELERLQQCLSGARSFTDHDGVRGVITKLSAFIGDRREALKAA